MRYLQPKYHRGMTLVEMLVSVVIISIGLLGVSQLILVSSWTLTRAKNISLATKRAEFELDQLHNLGYDALVKDAEHLVPESYPADQYASPATGLVTFAVPEIPNGAGTITIAKNPFGVAASTDPPVEPDNLLSVVVRIAWKGTNRHDDFIRVTTFISKRPTP